MGTSPPPGKGVPRGTGMCECSGAHIDSISARRDKPPGAPSPSASCGRAWSNSAGYTADHCCDLGHELYVVEGELDTELRDGRTFKLRPGMSCQVSDRGDAEHPSSTQAGAKLFIVD